MYKDCFEAKFENVGGSIARAQACLADQQVDEEVASMCMLALSEAINNVVEHAYPDHCDGLVELHIQITKTSILFQVRDCGAMPPSDLFASADDMPDPFDLPEGGWGLSVISSVMDDIGLTCENGFNQLNLVKHLSQKLPAG